MKYVFEGSKDTISDRQLEFISEILEKRGFKATKVLIEDVGGANDNFAANVKRIVVEENGKKFNMVGKIAPSVGLLKEIGTFKLLFGNEHFVYTNILPKLRSLQKEANVPEADWFHFPECYGSSLEEGNEVLLLEDMTDSDFKMLNKHMPLSNEAVKLVLKNFAIFHSLFYVIKNRDPELYKYMASQAVEAYAQPHTEMQTRMYLKELENTTLRIVNEEKVKNYLHDSISTMIDQLNQLKKTDSFSKYSVIAHGDGWSNNILFKMENNIPKQCTLIDYQIIRESSPVLDIMYMIFNSTSHSQRVAHYFEFLDYYYEELDKSLKYFGLEAKAVYPREQFDADLKLHGRYLFCISLMVCHFVLKSEKEAEIHKESMKEGNMEDILKTVNDTIAQTDDSKKLFNDRISSLVDSFVHFEYM